VRKVPPFPYRANERREFLQAGDSYHELSVESVGLIGKLLEAERTAPQLRTGMLDDEIASTLAIRRKMRGER